MNHYTNSYNQKGGSCLKSIRKRNIRKYFDTINAPADCYDKQAAGLQGREKMKYKILFLLITGALAFWHSACAQGSRHFRSHSMEPPPMPPREYSRESRFYRFSSRDVVTAFKKSGLEVVDLKPGLTVGAPGARESTIFLIPSFGKNIGSLVSSYSSEKDLQNSIQYYVKMNKNAALFSWRIFTKDNILLLISEKVPEKSAQEYEKVLISMD